MNDLPPGCHIIPPVEVPLNEQRRILLRMLRHARGPLRSCRRDIIEMLHKVEREIAAREMMSTRSTAVREGE
jgi:hypothetical protein